MIYTLQDRDRIDLFKSIQDITSDLHKFVYKQFTEQISIDDADIIIKYIQCQKTEINLSNTYKRLLIISLIALARYFKNKKNFVQLARSDMIRYFNSLRKSDDADPEHKWIGTYNLRRQLFLKFFKWLYYPTKEAKKRQIPEVMRGILQLKRKEQSIYKPDDLWSPEDDQIFLKYCSDKRMQCYHAISRDTSARPSEILKLRVREINFKLAGDKTYAQISVNGKTGSRTIPLFNSIPYIKDWLNNHPQPSNPEALLIPSMNRATFGRKLSALALNGIYRNYRTKIFLRLLSDENVPKEDKNKIRELLMKPWNPYIRRHSGLTEKSKMKYINEHQLRQHAGWSPRSQMHLKYIHYFGNESNDSLLEAYGLVTREQELVKTLHYKQCPNCNEPNKSDSRFCAKCRLVLSYDAYNETLEEQKKKEDKLAVMEDKLIEIQLQMQTILSIMSSANSQDIKEQIAKQLIQQGIYKAAA